MLGTGCDDSSPSGTPGDGSVDTGPNPRMDMGPMTGPCLEDGDCADSQYCDIEDGAFSGTCRDGCRDGGCPAGQECGDDHMCRTPPCGGDGDCPTGQYCDAATMACTPGCRVGDAADCPPVGEDGRAQACNPTTHVCETLTICCGDTGCEQVHGADACAGEVLMGALSCQPDPCGTPCPGGNDDCAEDQFCNDDGRCQDGCRLEAGSCPPGQSCDPALHACLEQPCVGNDDCAGYQFCDGEAGAGICSDGCRDNAACGDGEICERGVCVRRCVDDGDCGNGQYCDPDQQACRDNCASHEDCEDNEACDFSTTRCVVGACRDDATEPGDSVADGAIEIDLGAADADGFRSGEAEGTLCGADSDFFTVRLNQGERLRVRLFFDEQENLDLRLSGPAVGDEPIEAIGFDVPEEIVFPAAGVVNNATDYTIEVFGAGGRGTAYRVQVTVAPAEAPCFPDALEQDDRYQDATVINANLERYEQRLLSLCPRRDVDWFRVPMQLNDGLRVEVVTASDEAPISIALFSRGRVEGAAGGGPNYNMVVAENRAGRVAYVLDVPANEGAFTDEDWFIRIQSSSPDGVPDYDLTVLHTGDRECQDDGYEPNDGVRTGTDLDTLPGVGQGGQVPYSDMGVEVPGPGADALFVCTFNDDYYCLDLDAGDGLEAWAVGDGVAGNLEVRIVDDRGQAQGAAGTLTGVGDMTDPARFRGAPAGRYCIVVDGQAAAQGPYQLFVRRFEIGGGECGADPELEGGNNNTPPRATRMVDVGAALGVPDRRFEYDEGVLCGPELDWYVFPVRQPRSRVCVTMDGFRNDLADLELEVFHNAPDPNPENACMSSAQCDGGAECIQGFCQAPVSRSTTTFDAELVDLTKQVVGPRNGEYLVKVSRDGMAAAAPYRVSATVTPEDAMCPEDWQERGDPNNVEAQATPLGSGQIALCDAWICENEAADWYSITVPAGEDRTIFIEFQSNVDGRLFLDYQGAPSDPEDMFSGFRRSADPVGNAQCINVRGGAQDQEVLFRVFANLVRPDGDNRVDYSVRVVPTDLSGLAPGNPAAQYHDHQGECLTLGGGDLGTCPFEDPFADGCWPFAILP
ncbi:MAG: hypothetical protein R3F60_23770 [bacterium]